MSEMKTLQELCEVAFLGSTGYTWESSGNSHVQVTFNPYNFKPTSDERKQIVSVVSERLRKAGIQLTGSPIFDKSFGKGAFYIFTVEIGPGAVIS